MTSVARHGCGGESPQQAAVQFRIDFLIRALGVGGAERQLCMLAEDLSGRGHRVRVLTFYDGGRFADRLRSAAVPVLCLGKRGRWDLVRFFVRLVRALRADPPDVLHGYLGTANILAACAKPFLPGVRVAFGVRASTMPLTHYDWTTRQVSRVEAWLSRFAEGIVVNSDAGRRHAVDGGFPPDRIAVIANGIDGDAFRPDPEARTRLRQDLGVAGQAALVGMAARYDPMKDYGSFVAAARLVADRDPDVHFVLAGPGVTPDNAALAELVAASGLGARAHLLGERADIAGVLAGLDVFVLSSAFGEGFPNVVGEAMACGVPCVVTDVGDSAAVVGDTGRVVPPGDPAALAEAMTALLAEDDGTRRERRRAARRRIEDHYGRRALSSGTERFLALLANSPARSGGKGPAR